MLIAANAARHTSDTKVAGLTMRFLLVMANEYSAVVISGTVSRITTCELLVSNDFHGTQIMRSLSPP
jgi:hypothetical protein